MAKNRGPNFCDLSKTRLMRKMLTLLFDIRIPYFLPFVLVRNCWRRFFVSAKIKETVYFAITIDTEQDYGSIGNNTDPQKTADFLNIFPRYLKKRNWPATFFVQGELVPTFKKQLKKIESNGHEIGLHGLYHELWGSTRWFLKDKKISRIEREKRLKKALDIFKKSEFKIPTSFRAPNLIIDEFSRELLAKKGFTVDSSSPAFLGWQKTKKKPLSVIPISADPLAKIKIKYGLPFSDFRVFNLANLLKFKRNSFYKYLNRILSFGANNGLPPYLVFLAHSWEFASSDLNNPDLDYSDDNNYEKMFSKLDRLVQKYDIQFVTIQELAQKISDKRV